MARHQIRAAKPKPEKPKAELRAAPSWYDRTHPVGSAERFLDEAAKEALAAAAAGGVITPRQAAVGAVRAVAKKASEYPDPLLAEAAALPREELMKRAARASAYEQAMRAQNAVADVVSTSMSPVADLARSQAAAAIATRQARDGGNTMDDVEKMTAAWRRRHDEMERGVKFIGRGNDISKPKAVLKARGNPVPQTLAAALGAEVDPMEVAKAGYRAIANREIDDPLLSPGVARIIGAGLAEYQGIEAVAGAMGIGSQRYDSYGKQVYPIEGANARPVYDASRRAVAGYVAEKTGKPVTLESLSRGLPKQVRGSEVFASLPRRQFNKALSAARDIVATYNLTKHLQDKVKQGVATKVEEAILRSLPSLDSQTLPGFFRGVMSDSLKDNMRTGGENFPSLSLGNRIAPQVLGYGGGRPEGSPARNLAVFFRQDTTPLEPEVGGVLTAADSFSPSHDTAVASHVVLGNSLKQLVRDWYLSPDADVFRAAFDLTDDPSSALGIRAKNNMYDGLTTRAMQYSNPELKIIGRLPYSNQTISGAYIPSDMNELSPREAADLREVFNSAGIPFVENRAGRYGLPKAHAFGNPESRSGISETEQALMLLLGDGYQSPMPRNFDPSTPRRAQPVAATDAEARAAAASLLENLMLEPRELYGHDKARRIADIERLRAYLEESAEPEGVGVEDVDPKYQQMIQQSERTRPHVGTPVPDKLEPEEVPLALKAGRARRNVRAAEGGGDAGSETAVSETSVPEGPAPASAGPRIVINPTTFKNSKDALCVAFNEGFRLWMEATGFEPQSEPTDAQRKFFSDTAYADDEVQLRRTILARIATFDTSVKDPTDDQLSETASFLNAVLESDWCKNDWERNSVQKLARAVEASVGAEPVEPKAEPVEPRAEAPLEARAALGGGETDDKKETDLMTSATDAAAEGLENMEPEPAVETQAATENPVESPVESPAESPAENPVENPPAQDQAGQAPEPGKQENGKEGQAANPAANPAADPEEKKGASGGLGSGVWTGGAEGKGRQLTAREAEWMKNRIDSGASVSGQQLAMFGLSRNEQGQIVNGDGELHRGFGSDAGAAQPAQPDAMLDAREKRVGAMNGPSIQPVRKIGDIGATSFTDTKSMNGPSIQPVRKIGDIGATSFTDTKSMNGPSIEPARPIGDIGTTSFTDNGMNGPSIAPVRPIGAIDTADGSGGSTLRRKKRRRSRT